MSTKTNAAQGPLDRRRPRTLDAVYVLVYTVSFILAGLVALAPDRLSNRFEDRALHGLMCGAGWAADRVYWPEHDWIARGRRRLCTDARFRRFTSAWLDDAVSELDERAGYVGTVSQPDAGPGTGDRTGAARGWLECRLHDLGFHRNEAAYLKYRERDGRREFERSSWVGRTTVDAERQLHLRLYDGPGPGTVDVYAHWEPSITQGEEHYRPPDYRAGVRTTLALFEAEGIPVERRGHLLDGTVPADYDCTGTEAGPLPPGRQ